MVWGMWYMLSGLMGMAIAVDTRQWCVVQWLLSMWVLKGLNVEFKGGGERMRSMRVWEERREFAV